MIKKYVFGTPFETEAVVHDVNTEVGALPYFQVSMEQVSGASSVSLEQSVLNVLNEDELSNLHEKQTSKYSFRYVMDKEDIVYGLGENIRGINKRGWTYTSYAMDDPNHLESIRGLYAAHNFFILDGKKERFGVFFDYPGEMVFDIGYSNINEILITPASMDMKVYIIHGDSLKDIVKQFRHMIGRSYIAPRWALGYGQSRWGYASSEDIREVCKGYRSNEIPLDLIYVDIDYMKGYRNFTIDKEVYPDFAELVQEMKKENIHLVPIIDAGVKAEKGYFVDDEGVANDYFMKNEDGSDFVGTVWPGEVHFPDFLNPAAREWFGNHYRFLLDQGIDAFWNDMNEPAIFYSRKGMEGFRQRLMERVAAGSMSDAELNGVSYELSTLKNSREDYKSMYHNVDGKKVCHDDVHNLYGYNMTRAADEAFERLRPDERILMFSRSSYTGMHRYGGVWTGDNASWWSHLKLNLSMLPGLNMQGFVYSGADLGGFGADVTEDLLMRWIQLGVFTPLMRNHSAKGTREQEVYRFTDIPAFRNIIGIRYFLLPYIYSEYMKACLKDEMLFRPLAFDYENDEMAAQVDDQLMMGDSIMIAPVLTQNATGRYVYLPEEMMMLRFRSSEDYDKEILPKGHHYVKAALDEFLLFIRPDHMIVISKGGKCEPEVDFENVAPIAFVKTEAVYEYYHDDGCGKDFNLDKNVQIIRVKE